MHQNIRVARPDDAAGVVTQLDRRIRNADVVENAAEIARGNSAVDGLVDLIGEPLGFLNARAGVRADVQQELPGVHARKKIAPQYRRQQPRHEAKSKEEKRERPAMLETTREQRAITVAKTVETALEAALKFYERQRQCRSFGIVMFTVAVQFHIAVKPHHQGRHERSRNDVAGEHREHHGFGQRHKQITRHTREKKHRHEHDANTQRRDERRQRDFLRAGQNGFFERLARRHVVMDIFNRHRRIVHQDADRQRETAERHQVDRFTERAQTGDGTQHGKRNGKRDDERAAPRTKEQQYHQRGQRGGNHAFA